MKKYLLSILLVLFAVNSWGFAPGFISTATHRATGGEGTSGTSACVALGSGDGVTVKIAVYKSATRALLASTSDVVSTGTGTYCAALSAAVSSADSPYYISMITTTGARYKGDSTVGVESRCTTSTSTFPSTLPTGDWGSNFDPQVWIRTATDTVFAGNSSRGAGEEIIDAPTHIWYNGDPYAAN